MSIDAVVQHVSEVMRHAHALFEGAASEPESVGGVRGATDRVDAARQAMTGLAGRLPTGYDGFAADGRIALDGLAGADDRLGTRTREAADANRQGLEASGRVVTGAAADTARMAPATGTPAGQRALLTALRDRVIQQQHVVAAYQARDARMAALVRGLVYQRSAAGPSSGGPTGFGGAGGLSAGGGLGAAPPFSAAGWPRVGGGSPAAPRIVQAADWTVPSGPGGRAAEAALGKRGRPYVWGAKGPNVFDCSGLTQWAWRQAGVQLGGDTYAQVTEGVAVPPEQVRAGDLIFPRSSFGEGGQPGPGHVMLAISATEVVHAPHTGDVVRVAPMPSAFVARRPVPPTVV